MKMRTMNVRTHLVLSLAAALPCLAAQAATYNFEVDFSTTVNDDSSIWSYRYQAEGLVRDGVYELLPNATPDISGIPGFNGWQAPGVLPQVVKNTTPATVRDAGNMIVPPGQSVVHPADGQLAVVSWLAPASGTVRVDFRFTDLDAGCGEGIAWYVDKGDEFGTLAAGTIPNGGDSGLQTVATLTLAAGERVNFIVDPNGTYACDSTRLFAEITYLGTEADFSLERDFTFAQNSDTSMWSYRFQSNGAPNNLVRDGSYELLPDQKMNMDGYSGINGWAYQANPAWPPGGLPEVGKNTSGTEIVGGVDFFRMPAGQCYMHPAPDQIVVVSWLAPRRGAVRVNYRFADLNGAPPGQGDTGVTWFVDKGDGSGNLAAGGLAPGEDSGLRTLRCVNVAAGDRIHFIVDPTVQIYFDATRVFAEISYLDDFDLERDFPTTENTDSSVWSYRYQGDGSPNNLARDGSYELLPDAVLDLDGTAGLNGWAFLHPAWPPGNLPQVTKNTGVDMAGGVPAGQCNVHPAPSQIVGVSWLAPSNGLVRLEFQFTDLNPGCDNPLNGVLWFVDNGSAAGNLASGSLANGGDSGLQALHSVPVAAGDRINFVVDPNGTALEDIYCDLTRVFARITYVSYPDFDFERDFSGSINTESSVWSYRYQADGDTLARDGSYELLPESVANIQGIAGFNGWQLQGGLPQVAKNTTGATVHDPYTMFVPAGQSQLHPNPNQIVVVSWLVPSNGTVRVDFRFTDLNAGDGDGVLWYVDKGDASGNLASGNLANGGDSGPQVISRLQVAAGDRIHFIVDPKGGNHGWDSTRLMARIAYVTETDFDFERDFSTVQNSETSTWSYRYQTRENNTTLRDGNYALLPNLTTGAGTMLGMNGWYDAASPYLLPLVVKNLGNTIAWDGWTQWTPPGMSTVHPDDGQIVVVSWLAPSSGSVQVEFQFTDLNWRDGNGVLWFVDKGDLNGNLAGGSFDNGGGTTLQVLPSVPVAAGDRINFVVDPNGIGLLGWDATRVFARITYSAPPPGPTATASIVEGMMRISFDTQAGFQYRVEYTDVWPAAPTDWFELFGSPVEGTGAPLWLDDPAPWDVSTQRFYRLQVQ